MKNMQRLTEEEVRKELELYKHSIEGQVRFHEVDSLGVVHNIQYLYFFEWARTKYLEFIGLGFNSKTYTAENPIMTVRHEINYFNPAMLAENYTLYSRVSKMGKSSFEFKNVAVGDMDKILAKASSTLVYLSTDDYRPTRIPDEIREAIERIEIDNVKVTGR